MKNTFTLLTILMLVVFMIGCESSINPTEPQDIPEALAKKGGGDKGEGKNNIIYCVTIVEHSGEEGFSGPDQIIILEPGKAKWSGIMVDWNSDEYVPLNLPYDLVNPVILPWQKKGEVTSVKFIFMKEGEGYIYSAETFAPIESNLSDYRTGFTMHVHQTMELLKRVKDGRKTDWVQVGSISVADIVFDLDE